MSSATARQVERDPIGAAPLLEIKDLRIDFRTPSGPLRAVDGVSFQVFPGQITAIVGESGCGKSVTALAAMGLLPHPAGRVSGGQIRFKGQDLTRLSERTFRTLRGRDIAMIFQEPMTSLNPLLTVGAQITEPLVKHLGMGKQAARNRAVELLALVGIADGERRLDQYPHHFSGGMRQRVMIAMALGCNPKVLIADEPTTALDVTIQAQILALMKKLSRDLGIAIVVITHNLGIVARYADHLNVMYAGRIVESGLPEEIFANPRHPYTLGLLRSVPRLDQPRDQRLEAIEGMPPNLLHPPSGCDFAARCSRRKEKCGVKPELLTISPDHLSACHYARELGGSDRVPAVSRTSQVTRLKYGDENAILVIRNLHKSFPTRIRDDQGRYISINAVNDVSFSIRKGETLGLVGESGCGKTTIGRLIMGLERPSSGEILFRTQGGTVPAGKSGRVAQMVFQDPGSSLNPRLTIGWAVAEPMLVHRLAPSRQAARRNTEQLLELVGLPRHMVDRYPHELSGGQRQRVAIARALAISPDVIVCDEPVSALDVSIQAQIINLLEDLKIRLRLTLLFIAHDLAVVRHISDRVVVMYLGKVLEVADSDALYSNPRHPYTKALLDAVPIPDPRKEKSRNATILAGELPSPLSPPSGCPFHTRCTRVTDECRTEMPATREVQPRHTVACFNL